MADSNIHHSMDLAIILIDGTSGKLASSPEVKIFEIEDNVPTRTYPLSRDASTYIYIDYPRVNRQMIVEANGYVRQKFNVDYSKMPEGSPILEVYLIPEIDSFTEDLYCKVAGKLQGITEIIGVDTNDVVAHAVRYDGKRNVMHIFENSSVLGPGGAPYAVLKMDDMTYETFHTDGANGLNAVKLRHPLSGELVRNTPVVRAIMGQTNDDGSYILLVRKKTKEMNYLIRYRVDGQVRYQQIDFSNTEESIWSLQ